MEMDNYYQSNIKTSRKKDGVYVMRYANQQTLIDALQQENQQLKTQINAREEVLRARLEKCYKYFEKQGLTDEEIINITQLDCKKF